MKLLTLKQHKALKSINLGYLQGMLQLQPCYPVTAKQKLNLSLAKFTNVHSNLCPWAGLCRYSCLASCGYNSNLINRNNPKKARIRRTKLLLNNPKLFLTYLYTDIIHLQTKASELKLLPVIRLNCLSDLDWPLNLFSLFPNIQFLDYTKSIDKSILASTLKAWPSNYHLTYSYNESTPDNFISTLYDYNKVNIAVIFRKALPAAFQGYPVIDGDISDLRFLDTAQAIIGLKFKTPLIRHGFKQHKQFNRLVQG